MTDMMDLIWQNLQQQISDVKAQVDLLTTRSERAETAGGVDISTLATAPHVDDSAGNGDLLWITDGRKLGEGVGNGTGVIAYFNTASDSWKRLSDDSDVVT